MSIYDESLEAEDKKSSGSIIITGNSFHIKGNEGKGNYKHRNFICRIGRT